ncbi:hypothetical protein GWI33_002382 [Rhynchophorus ferrugineus]|uniref:Uncharacterized protein n=1 Tax=Rhynchophorus ferrugineus TaxID=354439 RepID=A0A834MJL4_RHYFE|nr:hypothetical protein GWI33_002382 [Rhynchophorus ferrugineus]
MNKPIRLQETEPGARKNLHRRTFLRFFYSSQFFIRPRQTQKGPLPFSGRKAETTRFTSVSRAGERPGGGVTEGERDGRCGRFFLPLPLSNTQPVCPHHLVEFVFIKCAPGYHSAVISISPGGCRNGADVSLSLSSPVFPLPVACTPTLFQMWK